MLDTIQVILEEGAIAPTHAHDNDAGYDLYTPIPVTLFPNERVAVDTKVKIDIPKGYYGRLESKSGLMKNKGITCRGTIDSGYRGNIIAVLFNHTNRYVNFQVGDKITQIVFLKCENPKIEIVQSFDGQTDRDTNGFGSTGN